MVEPEHARQAEAAVLRHALMWGFLTPEVWAEAQRRQAPGRSTPSRCRSSRARALFSLESQARSEDSSATQAARPPLISSAAGRIKPGSLSEAINFACLLRGRPRRSGMLWSVRARTETARVWVAQAASVALVRGAAARAPPGRARNSLSGSGTFRAEADPPLECGSPDWLTRSLVPGSGFGSGSGSGEEHPAVVRRATTRASASLFTLGSLAGERLLTSAPAPRHGRSPRSRQPP